MEQTYCTNRRRARIESYYDTCLADIQQLVEKYKDPMIYTKECAGLAYVLRLNYVPTEDSNYITYEVSQLIEKYNKIDEQILSDMNMVEDERDFDKLAWNNITQQCIISVYIATMPECYETVIAMQNYDTDYGRIFSMAKQIKQLLDTYKDTTAAEKEAAIYHKD